MNSLQPGMGALPGIFCCTFVILLIIDIYGIAVLLIMNSTAFTVNIIVL
jgi:hypothetical protein